VARSSPQSQSVSASALPTTGSPVLLGIDHDLSSFPLDALLSQVTLGVSSDPIAYVAN